MGIPRALPRVPSARGRVPAAGKQARSVYQTREWKALVAQVIAERGKQCQDCGRAGFVYADHVVEIRDGGAVLDAGNLRLLCPPCHGRKTERKRRERVGLA